MKESQPQPSTNEAGEKKTEVQMSRLIKCSCGRPIPWYFKFCTNCISEEMRTQILNASSPSTNCEICRPFVCNCAEVEAKKSASQPEPAKSVVGKEFLTMGSGADDSIQIIGPAKDEWRVVNSSGAPFSENGRYFNNITYGDCIVAATTWGSSQQEAEAIAKQIVEDREFRRVLSSDEGLHTHILRTLSPEKIHHLLGEEALKVRAELEQAKAEVSKLMSAIDKQESLRIQARAKIEGLEKLAIEMSAHLGPDRISFPNKERTLLTRLSALLEGKES